MLYGEDGKILIDEKAAQIDIKRLNSVVDTLNAAEKSIKNLIQTVNNFKGNMANSTNEKACELIRYIVITKNNINDSIDFIEKTVKHYKDVDARVKSQIKY